MAASAYQLWLKKREFKAPRQSPALQPSGPSSFQAARGLSEGIPAKFHAVSGVETTKAAIRSVARPSAMRKRPRISREKAADGEEPPHDHKVAGRQEIRVDDPKVAGWKLQRSDKEGPNGYGLVMTPEEIDQDVELSELPQKSPMKKLQRKLRTAMLDESQYWMAEDLVDHV
ncbi:hypothetical protein GQ600_8802 [Phytophthora cactorum]|nr:hypothetical protein GQ600_8802 [Phytophthora cactorum]